MLYALDLYIANWSKENLKTEAVQVFTTFLRLIKSLIYETSTSATLALLPTTWSYFEAPLFLSCCSLTKRQVYLVSEDPVR